MGKLLDKKNKSLEKKYGLDATLQSDPLKTDDVLGKYEKYLGEKKVFRISFTACDRNGNFSTLEGEYIIILASGKTMEAMPYFRPRMISKLLGYSFNVKVCDIDKENKRIYVENAYSRADEKSRIERELNNELANNNYPTVWGKVTSVEKDHAVVDILGLGIIGTIDARHWKRAYTRNLAACCKKDDFLQFQVTHATKPGKGRKRTYLLDRRNISGNPWDRLPKDLIQVGSAVYVKCIELPEGKSFWWGSLELVPDIDIMGDWPGRSLKIVPELTYKCKVKELKLSGDSRGNILKVVPFEVAEVDVKRYQEYIKTAQFFDTPGTKEEKH